MVLGILRMQRAGKAMAIIGAALLLPGSSGCGSSDDDAAASSGTGGTTGNTGGSGGSGASSDGGVSDGGGSAGAGGASGSAGSGGAGGSGAMGGTSSDGGSGGTNEDASPPVDAPADAPQDGGAYSLPDCHRFSELTATLSAAADEAAKVLALDQFLIEVEASDGFPLRCAPDVTFFFKAPPGFGTPYVAGDFNGWDPTAAPMSLVAGDIYQLTLPVDQGPDRAKYKFTNGTQWLPDPRARRFGYDQYGEYSLVSGGVDEGHLERHLGIAGNGLAPRPLTVYLPPAYEATQDAFPVLYAHDGQNLFDPNAIWGGWRLKETVEQQIASGDVRPMVIVGIHNTAARIDEYTHVADMMSGQTVGGMGEAYFGLVRTRVMPLIEQKYRVLTGPSNTWTMGSSLGGLISLYFGLVHSDAFGRVAGLSSTLGWGSIEASNQTLIEMAEAMSKQPVVIYLDSGGSDGGGCVDSDSDGIFDDAPEASDNYCETIQMRDVLEAAGYAYDVDLFHWHEADALHNEQAWADRVALPLSVLAAP